ncbi:hypothetical protein VH441_00615 [Psychrobacter sp. HD31]|uniref:hypothetical protein n=1 Tax=Psychrobacter sp. HD31 TaxID=3112003 RepID=UPI003DA42FEA
MTTSNQTPITTQINRDELLQLLGDSQDSITCKVEQIELLDALKTATKAYTQTHSHDTQTIRHLQTIDEILTMDFTTDSKEVIKSIDLMRIQLQTHMPAKLASEPTKAFNHQTPTLNDWCKYAHNALNQLNAEVELNQKAGLDTRNSKAKLEAMDNILSNIVTMQELQAEYDGYKVIRPPSDAIVPASNNPSNNVTDIPQGNANIQNETISLPVGEARSNIDDLLCVYEALNNLTSLFATIKALDSISQIQALARLAQLSSETNADFIRHTINRLNDEMAKTTNGRVGGIL